MAEKIKFLDVDFSKTPLNDYPRPSLMRNKDTYMCLNGKWDYCITKNPNEKLSFKNKVMVPYAVEAPLSGVNHLFRPDEYLIYSKVVKLPKSFKDGRLILHFDGVDQICDIYINATKIGKHVGGYTKFSFDITEEVKGDGFYLYVVCVDKSDTSYHSRGKQKLDRGGIWYTTTSGIYKPVWLECVPNKYITNIKYTTLFDEKCINLRIDSNVDGNLKVKIGDQEVLMNANQDTLIKLKDFEPWTPENPKIYPVEVIFFNDIVKSYIGLRKVEIKEAENGHKRIFLNNVPYFIKGLLDQGYYFLGGLTPETYSDYKKEILNLKSFGFNCIRKHIKTECEMFYFLCDLHGMLVIQDFINGGEVYSKKVTISPAISKSAKKIRDNKYSLFGRNNEKGRNEWIKESLEIQKELYNNPSVIMYTIFNEGWGQFDSSGNYNLFRENDPTRIYDTNSGWIDQGASDLNSIHNYFFKHKIRKDPFNQDRPQFLSEFGGYGLRLKDHFYGRKDFGYKNFGDSEKLSEAYEKLILKDIVPLIKGGLCGFIYTQVSDVEDEVNGLYTFDREVLKIDKNVLINCNIAVDKEAKSLQGGNKHVRKEQD